MDRRIGERCLAPGVVATDGIDQRRLLEVRAHVGGGALDRGLRIDDESGDECLPRELDRIFVVRRR